MHFEMSFIHPSGQVAALHVNQARGAGFDAGHDGSDHKLVHVRVEAHSRTDAGIKYMAGMIRRYGEGYKHPGQKVLP
jgi:hypothetical protein